MNEREKFLKSFQSLVAKSFERIEKMNEAQVLQGLRSLKAARDIQDETLAFLHSVSLKPADDSEDEINKLRAELSSKARTGDSSSLLWDYMEDALKKRLEALRKKDK